MIVNPGTNTKGAPEKHAAQHAASGSDPVTPESIGAAVVNHTHTAADVGAAEAGHTHTPAEIGARPDTWTPTAAEVGAAAANHTHTAAEVGAVTQEEMKAAIPDISGKLDADATAAAAAKLAAAQTIDGMAFDGSAAITHYNTCATAAATAAKTVSKSGFSLVSGARIAVRFTYANTAASPTLNVNSTGAKAIRLYGTTAAGSGAWAAGEVVEFVYYSSYWYIVDGYVRELTQNAGDSAEPGTAAPLAAGTAAVGTSDKYAREDHVHPSQTTVSGNAGTATKLATARTIDGVSFNGSAAITHYGTCATAAATAAKVVSCTGFTLVTGARIAVKFTNENTASTPTLNVNSTGAKNIVRYGTANMSGSSNWVAGEVVEFFYDGTNWVVLNGYTQYLARNHTHSNYVPTTRTINGKALSADITLTVADLGISSGGELTLDRRTLSSGAGVSVSVSSIGFYLACVGGCEPVVVDVVDIPTNSSCYVKNQAGSNMLRLTKTSTSSFSVSNESNGSLYAVLIKLAEG